MWKPQTCAKKVAPGWCSVVVNREQRLQTCFLHSVEAALEHTQSCLTRRYIVEHTSHDSWLRESGQHLTAQ
eukprot:6214093-Pleurochrysis_carterae.AAC.8